MYQAIRFEVSLVLYIMTIRFVTLMVSTEVMRCFVIARQGMTSRVLFYSNGDSVVVGRSDQMQLVLTRMPFDLESRSITINCIADGILGVALEGCHRSWLAWRRRGVGEWFVLGRFRCYFSRYLIEGYAFMSRY